MRVERAEVGMKVNLHPSGSVLTIKDIAGYNAVLVKVLDDGSEEDWGVCPLSLLDEVEK